MKKALNLSFYESIIKSEFNLITKTPNRITSVSIALLCKELKQIIKLINFFLFINRKKSTKQLVLLLPNKVDALLSQRFLKTFNAEGSLKITRRYTHSLFSEPESTNLLISSVNIKNETVLKNLIYNQVCLLVIISLDNFLKDKSFYQLYNILDSQKKLLFLLILLDTLVKKT